MNTQKYISLFCAMMLVGAVAMPVQGAISFSSSGKLQPKKYTVTRYLDASNPDLRKALDIHNLLNEMPDIQDMLHTSKDLSDQADIATKQMEAMSACHAQKLGDVFKDPKKAWGKMMDSYEQKRQGSGQNKSAQSGSTSVQKNRLADDKQNMLISRDIMMDVYQNPSKWGQTKDGASFPLWQDQITVFEKKWNDFYDKMNTAFGADISGRPDVDEKTRQNAQKYNEVLKAHKAYLSSLQSKKNMTYQDLPPKAPTPLPSWQNMVFVDPDTNQVYPEMPSVWKDAKARQDLIKSNPNGELAQAFKNGNVNTPSETASSYHMSDLESEYHMRVAVDSLEKGSMSVKNSMNDMQQDFVKKLSEVGINVEDLNLANKGQYLKIQKQLRNEKKKAIAGAQQYIAQLEKQDAEHPELVQQRQNVQARKQARMSEKARKAISESNGIVQISQMSPVMQQKFVIAALEKDKDALVHLTETNAMDVDQKIRERQATNKIIAESQKQMETVYDKQLKNLPLMTNCSVF